MNKNFYKKAYKGEHKSGIKTVKQPNEPVEETRIDLASLLLEIGIEEKKENEQVGVISYRKGPTAWINSGFGENTDLYRDTSVIFLTKQIETIPANTVFDTYHNVYLVLFSVSGTVEDRKTGIIHQAIDSTQPIKIIRVIPQKNCVSIILSPDEIVIKARAEQTAPALTEEMKERIFFAIKERILRCKGAIKPSDVPPVLDSLHEYGITRSIYGGQGLQFWIKNNFPELYISESINGGGREFVYLWKVLPEDIEKAALNASDNRRIHNALVNYLRKNSSVALADISRMVFMPNGLDIRFYPLGKSANEWVAEQSAFVLSDDMLSVSLSKEYVKPISDTANPFTDSDATELDLRYNNKQYVELLSCDTFRRIKPSEIPIQYMEKALTAANRILFGESSEEVHLNEFQRILLGTVRLSDISEWTGEARYNGDIVDQCIETMVYPATRANAAIILKKLLHNESSAEQFLDSASKKTMGLLSRFQTARNEQTLPLCVIAVFAQNNQNEINAIISHYCRYCLELNKDSNCSANRDAVIHAMNLSPFLKAIKMGSLVADSSLDIVTKTLVLSVYIDTNSFELLDSDLIDSFFPTDSGYHRDIISLIKQHELWSKEEFQCLISKGTSRQLLEKCTAFLLGQLIEKDKCDNFEQYDIPDTFLRLLSWIVTYCDRATLEAVIDVPTVVNGKKIPRKSKCIMLLRSLPKVVKLIECGKVCYSLGVFISKYLFEETEDLQASSLIAYDIYKHISEWNAFSNRRFESKRNTLSVVAEKRKAEFADLIMEYWIDIEHEKILQKMYANELMTENHADPDDQIALMQDCLSIKAYEAYCQMYERIKYEGNPLLQEKHFLGYVNARIQTREFKSLIDYLLMDSNLENEERNRYLTKAICSIFSSFHYSSQSFAFFDTKFTVDNARILLQGQLTKSNYLVITSLIAIYIYQKDYLKARYLYEIHHSRAEIGNTRIYLQFKKLLDSNTNHVLAVGKENNHFNVLQTAFYVHAPQKLIQFLSWASGVKIPFSPSYNPQHVHILALSNLVRDPSNVKYWQTNLQVLSAKLTQYPVNAWLVCVCDGVLSSMWNLQHDYDVRRAYELVLTQIQDPNIATRFFPVALLPYITAYIMRKDDTELCRRLKNVVEDERLWNRLVVHNVWAKDYKESLSEFSTYCIRKLKETRDELYSELLKITAPSLSAENLLEVTMVSGNADYFIRKLCNNYLDGLKVSDSKTAITQIDSSNFSFRDLEALALLQTIYTDEIELIERHPDSFENEEDVYRFKQDCAHILMYYPALDGLRNFEVNSTDPSYNRLVFSYVFGAFYSQELYDKYSFDYSAFKHRPEQILLSRFLRKVFYAQLVYNSSYDFFYKRWRYLKIYLTMVIEEGGPADPSEIVEEMKSHHHDDNVYEDYFIPFKEAVDKYWNLPRISIEEKKIFLYCMMLGNFSEYLSDYAESFSTLTTSETIPMQRIVSLLDYREVSCAIYDYYDEDITADNLEEAKVVARALVPSVYNTLCEIETSQNREDAIGVFKSVQNSKPSQCVNAMIGLDNSRYDVHYRIINPLVCSRQFPFQIYKRFRQLVLRKQERKSFDRYTSLGHYLTENIDQNADSIFLYLDALLAGDIGDRQKTREILQQFGDDYSQIPYSWLEEADTLRKYASGQTEEFHAERNVLDASGGGNRTEESFKFCFTLIEQLNPAKRNEKLSRDDLLDAWQRYRSEDGAVSIVDRVVAGAQVLCKPKVFLGLSKGLGLSETPDKLALDLGMVVLQDKNNIPICADDRLAIVTELYEHNLDGDIVFPQFARLLKTSNCSIDCWCKHRTTIRKFISDSGYLSDDGFTNLYTEILEPCGINLEKWGNKQSSCEEVKKDLSEYLDKLATMKDSPFRELLYSAIKHRLSEIQNDVQLHLEVEDSSITDEYVYFSIENIGKVPVNSADVEITIQGLHFEQEDKEQFEVLYPDYIVGGRKRIPKTQDSDIDFQVLYHGIVLSRVVLQRGAVSFDEAMHAGLKSEDLYDVENASIVFGREEQLDKLHRMITKRGKAMIYGPSRIGKTSILDKVRKDALEQGNVLSITFAADHIAAKDQDYESIPYSLSTDDFENELLIKPIFMAFKDKRQRIQEPKKFSDEEESKICDILRTKCSIPERYSELDKYLDLQNLELWLILDEFQKAVSRWTPETTGAFYTVCMNVTNWSRIKLILCGADELLKQMVQVKRSVWRKLFPPDTHGIHVTALAQEPFKEMLCDEPLLTDRSIKEAGLAYSDEALEAVYRYTGGVPLYGKHICNRVFKALRENKEDQKRRKVFTLDIETATHALIREQNIKGDISQIFDDVTKGLDKDTDALFLAYIAQYTLKHKANGCPYSAFTRSAKGSFRLIAEGDEPYKTLDDSLAIAEARGIIKKIDSEESGPVYTFCTVFYYSAFLGIALSDRYLEHKLFAAPKENDSELVVSQSIDFPEIMKQVIDHVNDFAKEYKKLPKDDQNSLYGALTFQSDESVQKSLRGISGTNVTGDIVSGDKNIHVSVQSITNTLNSIFAAGGDQGRIISGLQDLPRLSAYYEEGNPLLLSDLHSDDPEIVMEAESKIEASTSKMVSDYLSALVSRDDYIEDFCVWNQLGIDKMEYDELSEVMAPSLLTELILAAKLDHIFSLADNGSDEDSSLQDYSPVSIMYCKILEKMLKLYHTDLYIQRFPESSTEVKDEAKHKIKFGDMAKEKMTDSQKKKIQNMILLGAFLYPINPKYVVDDRNWKEIANHNTKQASNWKKHSHMLSRVKDIRNDSAHGADGVVVGKNELVELKKLLLESGGLKRIIELV